MLKTATIAVLLFGFAFPVHAQTGFCAPEIDINALPDTIAGRPGHVEQTDTGGFRWDTTDRVLLTIEATILTAEGELASAAANRALTEQDLSEVCAKFGNSCDIEISDDGTVGMLKQSYEAMGSSLRHIRIYTATQRLYLRGIAPSAETDWLIPALDQVFEATLEDLIPPC